MAVAWRSGSQQGMCRLGTMGLGGLFLQTPNPSSTGSVLELLFDVAMGIEVRARAVVRNSRPGKGMGVKFVHMRSEDRYRLNQFLKVQLEAGNIQEDLPPEKTKTSVAEGVAQDAAASAADVASTSQQTADLLQESAANWAAAPEGFQQRDGRDKAATQAERAVQGEQYTPTGKPIHEGKPAQDDSIVSEEELRRYLALSGKSNHYQLLGVMSDAGNREIKEGFYALARKFHPDRHMDRPEWAGPLQQLMGAITEAHNVLSDEKKRGNYDRKLTHRQTEAEETVEECVKLAASAQRGENAEGAIFWMRKCVKIAPEVSKYRASLASSLAVVPHHRREAVEHFQKAIELDQWNTDAYLQLGELYEVMQLPWRAASLYSKILELDPGHALARQRLARTEGKEKKKTAPRMARLFSKKS